MEVAVFIVTIDTVAVVVSEDWVTIPDGVLADFLTRIEFVACVNHCAEPFHIAFGTDHTVLRTGVDINLTVGTVYIASITAIKVAIVVFVHFVAFYDTFAPTVGNFTDVAVPVAVALFVGTPFADEFTLVFCNAVDIV